MQVKGLSRSGLGEIFLELNAHRISCLSGPSGSGKTLLLRAIADLDVNQGQVWLNGRERNSFEANEWRRKVAYLPAESRWWAYTVAEHFPRMPSDKELARLGFGPDVGGWQVERLSSGERQRLSLLRLLANQPAVLLLDEPTANLDSANSEIVEALILSYLAGEDASCLWVTHDAAQARRLGAPLLGMQAGHLEGSAA